MSVMMNRNVSRISGSVPYFSPYFSADVITGHNKNDHLYGGAGNDTLSGGLGNNRLDGGVASEADWMAAA
jgi:hypothetical protein